MKYLFKYENYIQTSRFGENITEEEFNSLYNDNCKYHSHFKLIKYDENFSKHMNNFTANDEDLQIYCEGPVLLKKVDSIYDQFD